MRPMIAVLLALAMIVATGLSHASPEPRPAVSTVKTSGQNLGMLINKAGRQRMLTQRMAKAYAMLGLGIAPEQASQLLQQSRVQFEQQLIELRGGVTNDEIRAAQERLEVAWQAYRQSLSNPPTAAAGRQVYLDADAVLKAANSLTVLYEKLAGTTQGHLVNVSGRQRMLSQRMAKAYLFQQWGVNVEQARTELEEAKRDFMAALDELNKSPENTPDIRNELALANTQWMFFNNALSETDRDQAARHVASTSERILGVMEFVVTRYEALAP